MLRRPPRSTRPDTFFPNRALFRSKEGGPCACRCDQGRAKRLLYCGLRPQIAADGQRNLFVSLCESFFFAPSRLCVRLFLPPAPQDDIDRPCPAVADVRGAERAELVGESGRASCREGVGQDGEIPGAP